MAPDVIAPPDSSTQVGVGTGGNDWRPFMLESNPAPKPQPPPRKTDWIGIGTVAAFLAALLILLARLARLV